MMDDASSVPSLSAADEVRNVLHSATTGLVLLRSSAENDALDWTTEATASFPFVAVAVSPTDPVTEADRLVPRRATAVSVVATGTAAVTGFGPPLDVSRRRSVT